MRGRNALLTRFVLVNFSVAVFAPPISRAETLLAPEIAAAMELVQWASAPARQAGTDLTVATQSARKPLVSLPIMCVGKNALLSPPPSANLLMLLAFRALLVESSSNIVVAL